MNPFTTPDNIFVSRAPQDMRAGIQRLASIVTTDFGCDPMDGSLYVFVSRDCEKIKMLRFDINGFCMYYVRLCDNAGFKWMHSAAGEPLLKVERRELLWLLEGMEISAIKTSKPVTVRQLL